MSILKLYRHKLKNNAEFLNELFKNKGLEWGVVAKLLCGNEIFLQELINLGFREIHDARISNLKTIKKIDPTVQTVYIKPAPIGAIPDIIQYADVSLNTEYETIRLISEEAVKQKKLHKVIIMIEMGELREGVMGENLLDFYSKVFQLPGIAVIGLGTNLNCLTGVMPSSDKLIQLSLYKQLIEARFNRRIRWISGGSSVTIPLMLKGQLPKAINHLRVGETLFFGNNLVTGQRIEGMEPVFELFTEIIELAEKPKVPIGELGVNVAGDHATINEQDYGQRHYRAIIDIGLLDIDPKYLIPKDPTVKVVGASSDMIVIELNERDHNYKVGDILSFELKYMGALSIMNSNYIDKEVL